MKKVILILSIFVLVFSTLYSVDKISSFQAFSNGESINIEWRTMDESNIKNFQIERSSNDNSFKSINTVNSIGKANHYTYVDEEVFMKPTGGSDNQPLSMNIYKYRLRVQYEDGSFEFSNVINVTHQTSSIKRSWGMIKEMFR